jgi:hypothetical protein
LKILKYVQGILGGNNSDSPANFALEKSVENKINKVRIENGENLLG